MSAAAIFLVVNFFIGLCFSAVFAVVSIYSRWRSVALLFSAGLFIASLTMLSELGVAYAENPTPWAMAAYGTVLAGLVLLHWGVSVLYDRPFPKWFAIGVFLAGMAAYLVVLDLPRSWWGYGFVYQGPYALVTLSAAGNVFMSKRRTAMDRALATVLVVSGGHFLVKATLAAVMGPGSTASAYVSTNYAVVSQSITAVLIVAVGLMLLAVLTLDIMAVERGRAEHDSLSGLANRRGFEVAVKREINRPGERHHAVILCDLDHFKSINDTYGHHVGDMVISAFGTMIAAQVADDAIIGRIGGEEFAVFLPETSPAMAVVVAETLRIGARTMIVSGLPGGSVVTASFGVAALPTKGNLETALRAADVALYSAKRGGRDCVHRARELAA
ncbi:diguanylate cyclase (GGDEF)-like protein [Neorhizobium huautlense]|uniref:diguanylate cyclase n=1 Tax=Neorhizobium huautlense TaxID=67774 RepID=A0ABT9PQC2_9HYPH|nr:GGDEF domain-containing protein [Neorhizobium huautlense]MDP9836665.1 diguanylate cyclase (GGDEF)-like protein [Neorhizobium huautlense]